jgi:effector-binding domain-containing protein
MSYDIQIKDVPPQTALVVEKTVSMATIAEEMGGAFETIMAHVSCGGGQITGPPFCLYPDMAGGETFRVHVGMPVAPGATAGPGVDVVDMPGATVAWTLHKGPYSAVGAAYGAISAWVAANGRESGGPPREIYLNDPTEVPAEELLTEVDWPLD